MLAVLGMLVAEVYHPIDSRILGASIYHFHEAQLLQVVGGLIPSCIIIFLLEIKSINESWEFDDETRSLKRVANLVRNRNYMSMIMLLSPSLSPLTSLTTFLLTITITYTYNSLTSILQAI